MATHDWQKPRYRITTTRHAHFNCLYSIGLDLWKSLDSMQGSLIPSEIPLSERYCRIYPRNPFCRMMVKFYYPDKKTNPTPTWIYEEFTFNDRGEITFIEAWSYPERKLHSGGGCKYLVENKRDPVRLDDKCGPGMNISHFYPDHGEKTNPFSIHFQSITCTRSFNERGERHLLA